MDNNFKKSIVSGFIWSFLGQGGYLIIGLVANIILARLLTPFEFGQVGIIMFFIVIAKVLTESGLSGALVRKNDATEEDYSTVFIFNLVISVSLMLLLIVFSGTISRFYDDPQLKNILIVSSSVLLISAFQITQNIKLVRELQFKKKAKYEFIAIFLSSIIAVVLASNEAGVWSIVAMQISTVLILTILLWTFEGPLKRFTFNASSFKKLYKFGINTTLASLLNTAFDNIYQLLLGKYFAISQTGLYYQGKKLQEIPVGVISSIIYGVVFSTLSKAKDNHSQFFILYKRITTVFTVLVGLICLLIHFYANNIIIILYGEKWLESSFYLQILIMISYFYIQEVFNLNLFRVFNRTEKILYLEIVKKIIQSISIIIGIITQSIEVFLYGLLIVSFISFLINYYFSMKILQSFSWSELFMVIKIALISVFTYGVGYSIELYFKMDKFQSFLILPFFIISYFYLLKIFKVYNILRDIISVKKIINK